MQETDTKINVSRYVRSIGNLELICTRIRISLIVIVINVRVNSFTLFPFSVNEVSGLNIERVISIRGSVDGMSGAEAMISQKLRSSYESDLQVSLPFLPDKNKKLLSVRF